MKKTIKLRETELKKMIVESIRKVMNEGQYDEIKEIYYQLMNNIEALIDCLYDKGYAGDGCVEGNKFVEKLSSTRDDIFNFFAHPDVGGNKRVWDTVGF